MSIEQVINKKFLDGVGAGYLWEKIKARYDSKLDNVTAGNTSIQVANNNQISVKISEAPGNMLSLKTVGDTGLYVESTASERYEIVQDFLDNQYAAVYRLKRFNGANDRIGTDAGVINVPKDMVVQSGTVETQAESGEWGPPGTYLHLVLANADSSDIYIPVGSLVEYVTSGSQNGDIVFITVDPTTHQITASIPDGSIPLSKFDSVTRDLINNGGNSVKSVMEGSANGTISVDSVDVPVHGLGTAAYANASSFDTAGAAAAIVGEDGDTANTMTIYGVKQYASDVYTSIQTLSDQDIDNVIAAVEQSSSGS